MNTAKHLLRVLIVTLGSLYFLGLGIALLHGWNEGSMTQAFDHDVASWLYHPAAVAAAVIAIAFGYPGDAYTAAKPAAEPASWSNSEPFEPMDDYEDLGFATPIKDPDEWSYGHSRLESMDFGNR